jgi:hypothetical protein
VRKVFEFCIPTPELNIGGPYNMAIFEFHSCPKCRKSLESLIPKGSRGIDAPFRICPKCETHVIIKSIFNEWQLMNDEEKSNMKRLARRTAVIEGGTIGLLIALFGGQYIIGDQMISDPFCSMMVIASSIILGTLIRFIFVKRGLDQSIEKSNMRMRNPIYRGKLKALGLMPK